jgi:methylated-DNA-[protein]-cysteine S-methyltransferase
MLYHLDTIATPLGDMLLIADEAGQLRAAHWAEYAWRLLRALRITTLDDPRLIRRRVPDAIRVAFRAYFDGETTAVQTLTVATDGTSFQRRVWDELRRIPPGSTCTYRELARRIDHPSAVRAAGTANGANPICIAVPCHRIVGSDGSLTGFGGGLHRKQWLLRHEGALADRVQQAAD